MSICFRPSSIAVVGASPDLDSVAGLPIKYLQNHGYGGEIYPVNPSHDRVADLECYADVRELPEAPDLAMVILPARIVVEAVEDCFDVGTDSVLVVSSGFSETGTEEGAAAEAELAALAEEYDATLVGPNSQGLINVPDQVTACFTPALERAELLAGPVSFVTQSGAFGGALTTLLQDEGVGLNRWVATGNEADIDALDVIEQVGTEEETDVAAGYVEGFDDGRKLIALKRTPTGIELPIVVLKVGRSEKARSAAASHTGTIAGPAAVYDAVFRETGVMAVDDVDTFVELVRALVTLDGDPYPGRRVGVLSTSGGAGVHIADAVAETGLELPDLDPGTARRIEAEIPAFGSERNPVDLTGSVVDNPESFGECLRALLADDNVDVAVLGITNVSGDLADSFAHQVVDVAGESDTPLFCCWTGGIDKESATARYRRANIPVFENPARCVEVIGAIAGFAALRERLEDASHLPPRPEDAGSAEWKGGEPPALLSEVDAKRLLAEYGIDIPEETVVDSRTAAVEAAQKLGYPVVLKLLSPALAHRDEVGGVRLGLDGPDAVAEAYDALEEVSGELDAATTGVVVQRQVEAGTELGLGLDQDPDFGPIVMLGRGGVEIEETADVTFRTVPVGEKQAVSMLSELETLPDGLTGVQRSAVTSALTALSSLYLDNQWIREADVNPLILTQGGATAVDALFVGGEPTDR